MIRLTSGTGPVQIAGNDESLIIICHDMVQIACVHCGCIKNSILLFVPGDKMEHYDIKRALLKEQARCLCKREASK